MKAPILIKPFSHTLTDNIASALLLRPKQMVGFGFAAREAANTAALLARRLPDTEFQQEGGGPEAFRRLLKRLCARGRCVADVTGAPPALTQAALDMARLQPDLSVIACDSRTQTLLPLTPFPEAAHPRPWVQLTVDDFFTLCGVVRRPGGRTNASPAAYRYLAEYYDAYPSARYGFDDLVRLFTTLVTCLTPNAPAVFHEQDQPAEEIDNDILRNMSKSDRSEPATPLIAAPVPAATEGAAFPAGLDKGLEDLDLADETEKTMQDPVPAEIAGGDIQRNLEKPADDSLKETINAYLPGDLVQAVAYPAPNSVADIYFVHKGGKGTRVYYRSDLLQESLIALERHHLISDLHIEYHQKLQWLTVSFRLPEKPLRNLLTNKGSFLEGKAYTAISSLKADRRPCSSRPVRLTPAALRCRRPRLASLRRPRTPAPVPCFDDVVGNCCFCWEDPCSGERVDNELDALMTHGMQLFVCSCKDTRQDKQHLYELSSIAGQFSVDAVPLLVYSSDSDTANAVLTRASHMGVAVAQARSIGRNSIRRTLYRLLPYRGRCKVRNTPISRSPRHTP